MHDIESGKISPCYDMGYSFCNCRNIWFTDWHNIDQRVYNADYKKKYQTPAVSALFANYWRIYGRYFKEAGCKSFAEIGAINPALLDEVAKDGIKTYALDIDTAVSYKNHDTIIGDIEKFETADKLHQEAGKLGAIWMSHVFEHLHYPKAAAETLYELLDDGGLLFVAMPDPFQIDWGNVYGWGHWHVREHHIIWDMESFIEFMGEAGFKCIFQKRNMAGSNYIASGDYHLIFAKGGS